MSARGGILHLPAKVSKLQEPLERKELHRYIAILQPSTAQDLSSLKKPSGHCHTVHLPYQGQDMRPAEKELTAFHVDGFMSFPVKGTSFAL